MRNIDWDSVQEKKDGEFDNPAPGAYIAIIRDVEDKEDKEYLEIRWDFAEGAYQGANQETFDRAGFWPVIMRRSYKESALGFFKSFKNCVERSNSGYVFSSGNVRGLIGRYVGVVLGEEEYEKRNGTTGTRLYVAQVRSVQAIQDGDFKVPELKRMKPKAPASGYVQYYSHAANCPPGYLTMVGEDGDLPF